MGKLGCERSKVTRRKMNKRRSLKLQLLYNDAPKFCKQCNSKLPFDKRFQTFCNSYCAATHNNLNRKQEWRHNDSLKESRMFLTNEVPDGWVKGRKTNFNKSSAKCAYCNTDFKQRSNEKWCSFDCKRYHRAPWQKMIDDNIDDIITSWLKTKSIESTLKSFGVKGKRVGNKYLSDILKSRGYNVKRRGVPSQSHGPLSDSFTN